MFKSVAGKHSNIPPRSPRCFSRCVYNGKLCFIYYLYDSCDMFDVSLHLCIRRDIVARF